MAINSPTLEDLASNAGIYGLGLTTSELETFRRLMQSTIASYSRLDELQEPAPVVKYRRDSGKPPAHGDNPLGAWIWRSEIKGAAGGPLTGKTVAVKDNICLAGMPMTNGTRVLEGYVPKIDATVVTRLLDAGATIIGKSVCESLCFSGGSHTSDSGPVHNPYDYARSAGGSSSGSAALVAARQVDLALGGDQGGSIRIPASWCGVYGLKPTYGLVPYTGAFPVDMTLDHLGPMANSVADCALMLDAIAGADGFDPRQLPERPVDRYSAAIGGSVKGLRLAIVREGFGWEGKSESDVDEAVRAAANSFTKLGATVKEVSIPWHRDAIHVWTAIATEGSVATMFHGNGVGTGWKGYYDTGLLNAFARGWKSHPDDLSDTVKMTMLFARYMHSHYHGQFYAKAQNLVPAIADAYDIAMRDADILVMPTLPMKATIIPAADCSRDEYMDRAFEMIPNVVGFNLTGQPAMNVPCAIADGLPIGMMLVGRAGEDSTVLRAADAFQKEIFSPPAPAAK